jgi:hypothetical protein
MIRTCVRTDAQIRARDRSAGRSPSLGEMRCDAMRDDDVEGARKRRRRREDLRARRNSAPGTAPRMAGAPLQGTAPGRHVSRAGTARLGHLSQHAEVAPSRSSCSMQGRAAASQRPRQRHDAGVLLSERRPSRGACGGLGMLHAACRCWGRGQDAAAQERLDACLHSSGQLQQHSGQRHIRQSHPHRLARQPQRTASWPTSHFPHRPLFASQQRTHATRPRKHRSGHARLRQEQA